jgi:hypothetical protein
MLTKICTTCDVEKSVDEYYKKKYGRYGVRTECKCCISEKGKAYNLANKEAIAKRDMAYRLSNKEAIAKRRKTYRLSNKKAIAERNKAYNKANPHILNAISAKRKAAKLQATPAWADLKAIKGMYQLAALFKRAGINLHVDHIVPLISDKVCGLHCEANLQLLPATENKSKGNRQWPDM